jgi:hypothetical protein
MSRLRMLLPLLTLALAACASSPLDGAYEACNPGDACDQGTVCVETTLPASAGFQGTFCTNGCNTSNDCLQDLSDSVLCVNSQCYFQCPANGGACPNGTACLSFQDQNGVETDLCTP